MSPTLNQGDFTLVLSADPTEIRVGDIIVFWNSNNEKIIHRIIEIECGNNDVYFTTKGDNNQGMWDYEKHFSSQRVIGKVYARIPYPLLDALTFTLIFTLFTSGGYAIYKQISRQTSGS